MKGKRMHVIRMSDRKMLSVLLCGLLIGCAGAVASPRAPKPPPARNVAATTSTGLTTMTSCTIDIGSDGAILPHTEGCLAKDPDGNIWESRSSGGRIVFLPKAGGNNP
jgi:hypothetical protein